MVSDVFLIDRQLNVNTLAGRLSQSGALKTLPVQDQFNKGTVGGETGGPPLPVSPDGTLTPGVLYPSSTDAKVQFYLPTYVLNVTNGRYTTKLGWRGPADDPNGPLAFLTLEVIGNAPKAPAGTTLQEIPHQAVARLSYRMPVQGAPQPPSDPFTGSWINIGKNTAGMTRLDIARDGQKLTFHGWGKCHPQDCDWGVTPAIQRGNDLFGTYNMGFVTTSITVRRLGNQLLALVHDQFAPGDPRKPMDNKYQLALAGGDPVDTRPVMWIEIGALVGAAGSIRRCRMPVASKPDFDRLYSVMTDPQYQGALEIRIFATAGRRTWKQIVVGNPGLTAQKTALDKKVLFTDLVDHTALAAPPGDPKSSIKTIQVKEDPAERLKFDQVKELTAIKASTVVAHSPLTISDAVTHPVAVPPPPPGPVRSTVATRLMVDRLGAVMRPAPAATRVVPRVAPAAQLARPVTPGFRAAPAAVASPVRAVTVAPPGALDRVADAKVTTPILRRAWAPPLKEVLLTSDVTVKSAQTQVKAVPVRAVLNDAGQPALLQIPVQTTEQISPFCFPLATNAYMFDIPGDVNPQTHHILIRMEVRDGTGQVIGVFYQDSAYNDLFYYQPQEFRLPRADTTPYLPDLRVAFYDLVTQDAGGGGDQAQVNYKVRIAYRALPYMDPVLLDLAQQQVPQVRARFNALTPESSHLTLMVPEDETGGTLTQTQRPDAEIKFDQGIVDELELTRTEFERVFAFFQSPTGSGLDGTVEAALLGNVKADVPVRLSLKQNTGTTLAHTYKGPQGSGLHRVAVKNIIESPVKIESLFRVALGNGAFVFPQGGVGQTIAPGSEVDLDYQATPADAVVVDISPAITVSIQADPAKLWPQLLVNAGYTTDRFKVPVSIEPDFFGPPPQGRQQITAVQVEFDDGTQLVLTAAHLTDEANLHIPLLPRLLGDPHAKKYKYKVTNEHGDPPKPGESTAWLEDEGESPLVIVPAGA